MNTKFRFHRSRPVIGCGIAAVEALLMCIWLLALRKAEGDYAQYYSIYVLCAAVGLASLLYNVGKERAATGKDAIVADMPTRCL